MSDYSGHIVLSYTVICCECEVNILEVRSEQKYSLKVICSPIDGVHFSLIDSRYLCDKSTVLHSPVTLT